MLRIISDVQNDMTTMGLVSMHSRNLWTHCMVRSVGFVSSATIVLSVIKIVLSTA